MNDNDLTVTLTINGRPAQAQVIATFSDKNRNYIALAPTNGEENDIFLYRYKEIRANGADGNTIELIEILSDMEFNAALAKFEQVIGVEISFE
jgi:hypothetical protein